jgi:predicted KAP-like P-loop ATPase
MLTNDTPIATPDDDQFGVDPFARALARAVSQMAAPKGAVIAINGPWGCGKSSALNLVLFHVDDLVKQDKLKIIRFSPWWMSGPDAITAAFFSDLEAAIGRSMGRKALDALQKLTRRVLRFGKTASGAADLYAPGVGKVVEGATEAVGSLLPDEDDIATQHQKLAELLEQSEKRFLVVVDDIDRLSPEEAIQVFKLVKSVGQLPNVLYVLVFDRELAEKVIAERYPSEGPHYLEKIVQAAFEVPAVSPEDLREAFLAQVNATCEPKEGEDPVRVMNIMLGLVTPLLNSPRDLKRLIGMLQVTWAAVSSEVDRADFVAMEALRLFRPGVYNAIRASPDRLTGGAVSSANRPARDAAAEYDKLLLDSVPEADRDEMRLALRRLFPRLEAVWANTHYTSEGWWRRQRLVCTAEHFPTYFRFALGDELLPEKSIAELISRANDREFIQATFRQALQENLKSGRTRASVYLEELTLHAPEVAEEHIAPLVSALFEIGDELDVQSDEGRGMYQMANNNLRLHWLLNDLVRERLNQDARVPLLRAAMRSASLNWFCSFAERCRREHHPDERSRPTPEDARYVDEKTADRFIQEALRRLRAAARDGTLAQQRKMVSTLYEWVRLSPKGIKEVRPRAIKLLANDDFVTHLATNAFHITWSHSMGFGGMGDLVSRGTAQVNKEGIRELTDEKKFLARVRQLKSAATDPDAKKFWDAFMETWEKPDLDPFHDR